MAFAAFHIARWLFWTNINIVAEVMVKMMHCSSITCLNPAVLSSCIDSASRQAHSICVLDEISNCIQVFVTFISNSHPFSCLSSAWFSVSELHDMSKSDALSDALQLPRSFRLDVCIALR